eukprot:6469297-Amphidinium_carterae.1
MHPSRSLETILLSRDVSQHGSCRQSSQLTCFARQIDMAKAIQLKRKAVPMYGKFARARAAWYETCQQQNRMMLASCVLLPLYSNALVLACT